MAFNTVIIEGGLDLQSAPVAVKPGRLYACDNFEVDRAQGCKRVDGFERFDGGPSPSTLDCISFVVIGLMPDTLIGQYAFIPNVVSAAAVIGLARIGRNTLLCLRANSSVSAERWEAGASVSIYPYPDGTGTPFTASLRSRPESPLSNGAFSAAAWQQMVDESYLVLREKVQPVPGKNRVAGTFWLKDALYAARDYLAFSATGIHATLVAEDVVTAAGGFSAKVFSVTRDIDGIGSLVLHSSIGSFTAGTLLRGVTTVATVTAAAVAPGAGLYKAVGTRGITPDTQSWLHQDLGYSLRFKDGEIDFPSLNRLTAGQPDPADIVVTPWFVAGTLVSKAFSQVGADFINTLAGADVDDTIYANAPSTLNYSGASPNFHINNFGIADIDLPDGSVLTGIELEMKRRGKSTGVGTFAVNELVARFEYPGSPLVSFADTQNAWALSATTPDFASYETVTYGGKTNLLGCEGITPAIVKATTFGFGFLVQLTPAPVTGASPSVAARISMVRIRVHYIPPRPSYYIWDQSAAVPSAVVINIVKSYPSEGSPDTNDAQGTLYVMATGTVRSVQAGEQIRSMPQPGTDPDGGAADGSTLVATVAGEMTRNMLDGTAKLDTEKSKYQHVTANFYASADFEAIHGVSGAGPAFLYDGLSFARILTGTPIEKDTPRHATVHQSRLFLGYKSGVLQYSEAGDALEWDGVDGANEIGAASPVTGLYPMNGQTLAIFTRDNVQMMQGDVGAPTMGAINPDTGCIEYTAVSLGGYFYTSNSGVESAAATAAYGDFASESLSAAVDPWLSKRVQKSVAYEGIDRSVTNALMVRNKRQMRLYFADKKALTASFLRPGEMPQYTMQTYPVVWTSLMAATESTGRDRLFGATDDGYVFELDRGNRFDDAEITFSLTLATDDQQHSWVNKDFTDMHIHGIATGFGSFTMSRAVNYDDPDPAITFPQTFGASTDKATTEPKFKVSFTEVRSFGRSITYRFDGKTGREPPITLQAVSYNIIPAGEKRT